ncbi:hypothetical protein OG217_03665 [Streptomyces sp. NBC_01023]|uniref:hypothetical protein n=1 Tax=Streptomyces sp. NBC_01023 TaxID=2903724 RepID=UPI00386ED112|nr:hypothetical protein OG217_03665 [Streptomyces sp. NBC_01023]
MEQHIGPKSPLPVHAAATDPAYVPGLMPPRADAQAAESPEPAGGEAPERAEGSADAAAPTGAAPQTTAEDDAPDDAAAPESAAAPTEPAEADTDADADAAEHESSGPEDSGGEAGDDPAFEVADRRSAIIANRTGIVLRLDDQEAEFDWSEIGAVEFETAKYGRRLTVFVHMPNRHTYQADVTASGRDELKEWSARLDTVLDTYFEE